MFVGPCATFAQPLFFVFPVSFTTYIPHGIAVAWGGRIEHADKGALQSHHGEVGLSRLVVCKQLGLKDLGSINEYKFPPKVDLRYQKRNWK